MYTVHGSVLAVTSEQAPTTVPCARVTPGMITAFVPTFAKSSSTTGASFIWSLNSSGRVAGPISPSPMNSVAAADDAAARGEICEITHYQPGVRPADHGDIGAEMHVITDLRGGGDVGPGVDRDVAADCDEVRPADIDIHAESARLRRPARMLWRRSSRTFEPSLFNRLIDRDLCLQRNGRLYVHRP